LPRRVLRVIVGGQCQPVAMSDLCESCGGMFPGIYTTERGCLCRDCHVKEFGSEPDELFFYTICHD
jgi:hypothetical protein